MIFDPGTPRGYPRPPPGPRSPVYADFRSCTRHTVRRGVGGPCQGPMGPKRYSKRVKYGVFDHATVPKPQMGHPLIYEGVGINRGYNGKPASLERGGFRSWLGAPAVGGQSYRPIGTGAGLRSCAEIVGSVRSAWRGVRGRRLTLTTSFGVRITRWTI